MVWRASTVVAVVVTGGSLGLVIRFRTVVVKTRRKQTVVEGKVRGKQVSCGGACVGLLQ